MKKCQSCNKIKNESEFPSRQDRSGRLRPYCKSCANDIGKARYKFHKDSNPFLHKVTRARTRAKALKVPFNLTEEYLKSIWTGKCPITNREIALCGDRKDEYVAELDRFKPELGYTIGNVSFISRRANRQKNSTTVEELENLLFWMKNYENQ